MSHNEQPPYDRQLLHAVTTELQGFRDGPAFTPTADVDMVWVLAGPGTYDTPSSDGLYAAPEANPTLSYDRQNIETGIDAVRAVTAARLGIDKSKVTPQDVAARGPILFYNGEDKTMPNYRYTHNEALAAAVEQPGFPLPASNVVIDKITKGITPAQIEGYAEFRVRQIAAGEVPAKKIAVSALFWHLPRVGRYLKHYKDQLAGATFVPAPVYVPSCETGLGLALGEARRVLAYHTAGHLARDSAFARAA